MAFNRILVPSAAGAPGRQFAEFLGIDEDEELELTEMQSKLFDRLYRTGAIRHLDGSRANRRRARERDSEKRRRSKAKKARQARKAQRKSARKAKTRKAARRNTARRGRARQSA